MIPDGTHRSVLDRSEDTQESRVAVLVVKSEERLLVEPTDLPEEARHQNAVLEVTIEGGELQEATYEERETSDRQESAQSRFDWLSRRPPDSEDS